MGGEGLKAGGDRWERGEENDIRMLQTIRRARNWVGVMACVSSNAGGWSESSKKFVFPCSAVVIIFICHASQGGSSSAFVAATTIINASECLVSCFVVEKLSGITSIR